MLPSRLQKIRYYGWMSSNSRIDREEVRWLIALSMGVLFTLMPFQKPAEPRQKPLCNECGGELKTVRVTNSLGHVLYSRPPPYRDTG
ncbi:MAG: hypothetical protein WBD31_09115 [Rubripirellula sp.]